MLINIKRLLNFYYIYIIKIDWKIINFIQTMRKWQKLRDMLSITNIESIKKLNEIIFDNFDLKINQTKFFLENMSKIHIIMFF